MGPGYQLMVTGRPQLKTMNHIKNTLLFLVTFAFVYTTSAQAPNWTVRPSDFQYTMTVTAFLNIEGRTLSSGEDMAAAFVEDETRGVAKLIFIESVNRHLAYLTIYSNKENEEVKFKIYNSSTKEIVGVERTLAFKIDVQHGNAFQAYSLANPELSKEAEIKKFYFSDADTLSTSISEEAVEIEVAYEQDLSAMTPEFVISDGAKMYLDKTLRESGDTTLNFSSPITYSVLSEDESVLNSYQVSVKNQQGDDGNFLCTNVITVNDDGQNDFWIVQNASNYKDYVFRIFDVNGRILLESVGYQDNWDGYYKGKKLDRGKYYFKVESKEKNKLFTGNILVIY